MQPRSSFKLLSAIQCGHTAPLAPVEHNCTMLDVTIGRRDWHGITAEQTGAIVSAVQNSCGSRRWPLRIVEYCYVSSFLSGSISMAFSPAVVAVDIAITSKTSDFSVFVANTAP